MTEISSGWFIKLEPDEEKKLFEFLQEMDYSQDSAGIKEFLLDALDEETKPEKKNAILSAIHENPEAIQSAVSGIAALIGKALNKKIFKQ